MFWGQVLIGLWLRYIGFRDVGFSVKALSTKNTLNKRLHGGLDRSYVPLILHGPLTLTTSKCTMLPVTRFWVWTTTFDTKSCIIQDVCNVFRVSLGFGIKCTCSTYIIPTSVIRHWQQLKCDRLNKHSTSKGPLCKLRSSYPCYVSVDACL